jgi:hypothetical protein
MPWVKGQSGNPGHKSVRDVAWLRRLATEEGEKAIARLAKIVETSTDDKAAVQAAKELLDRAGCVAPQPPKAVEEDAPSAPGMIPASIDELRRAATHGEA